MESNQKFFKNDYNRIFTVVGMWYVNQPFVCGELSEIVEYSLTLKNGISHFSEITYGKIIKVSKKELKTMLLAQGENDLCEKLFSKY